MVCLASYYCTSIKHFSFYLSSHTFTSFGCHPAYMQNMVYCVWDMVYYIWCIVYGVSLWKFECSHMWLQNDYSPCNFHYSLFCTHHNEWKMIRKWLLMTLERNLNPKSMPLENDYIMTLQWLTHDSDMDVDVSNTWTAKWLHNDL
jgi:hypothetical protein